MMNPEIEKESGVIPREETDAALPRLEQELHETMELTKKRIAETEPTQEILDSHWDTGAA